MRVGHAAAKPASKPSVRAAPHKVACNSTTQVTRRHVLRQTNKIIDGNCMRNCWRSAVMGGNCATQGGDTPTTRRERASRGAKPPQHHHLRGHRRRRAPTNWIGNDDLVGYRLLDRKITYPDVPFLSRRQLPIQNRRGSAGDHKDRTTAGRGSTKSHVIRLHEHSTTSRNVAIPTITIQALNQSRGNYVRHWWALGNTSEAAAVLQRRLLTTLSTTGSTTRNSATRTPP